MKKLCALILCVLLVSVIAVTAIAAENVVVNVTASKTEVHRGETFTVTVKATGDYSWNKVAHVLAENLPFVVDEMTSDFSDGVYDALPKRGVFSAIDGEGFAIMISTDNVFATCSGDYITYQMKVKDDAPYGTYQISGANGFTMSNDEGNATIDMTDATVKVVCDHSFTGDWTPDTENANQHVKVCANGCGEKQTEAHSFTAQKDTAKHWEECACGAKKGEATHTFTAQKDTAKHWEACTCGEKKNEATHTFVAKKDAEKHWEECACGQKKGEAAHTFVAKKNAEKHWEECTCGEKKGEAAHTFTAQKDASKHWEACSCGEKKGEAAHTFTAQKDTAKHWEECACGQKKGEAAHDFDWGKDANNHWGACACGETKDVTPHTFTQKHNAEKHWEECECGEKKGEATHTFAAQKNDEKHWEECSCGEKKGEAAHTYANWTKVDDEKHQGTCACGQVSAAAAHTWDDGKVTKEPESCTVPGERTFECAVCKATKVEAEEKPHALEELEIVAGGKHKGTCAECHVEYTVEHEFAEELKSDADNHWAECACGEKKDVTAHAYTEKKNDANGHWTECVCGAKTEAKAHELTYKVEGDKHNQVCACGFATEKAAHAYDEKTGKCACGAEKPAEPTEPSKPADPTKPTEPTKDPEQPANGDNSFVMPLVILMVLSACGMAVTVIARKKIVR